MSKEQLRYDRMVEAALRGVVRDALRQVAERGLPGNHHFYLTFRTIFPGVDIPEYLREQYPNEMTIVLQYQFYGLEVSESGFHITLSFNNVHERLGVPFAAITTFADPSVNFALQFQPVAAETAEVAPLDAHRGAGGRGSGGRGPGLRAVEAHDDATDAVADDEAEPPKRGEVVTLDAFRKK